MKSSLHIIQRMNQRGIKQSMIDLVLEYGKPKGDKLIINKRDAQEILNEFNLARKELLKILDKGGVTLVVNNDTMITAYNTNR